MDNIVSIHSPRTAVLRSMTSQGQPSNRARQTHEQQQQQQQRQRLPRWEGQRRTVSSCLRNMLHSVRWGFLRELRRRKKKTETAENTNLQDTQLQTPSIKKNQPDLPQRTFHKAAKSPSKTRLLVRLRRIRMRPMEKAAAEQKVTNRTPPRKPLGKERETTPKSPKTPRGICHFQSPCQQKIIIRTFPRRAESRTAPRGFDPLL